MKMYRISTTISPQHYATLKKLTERYDSQRSVLEHALESLEKEDAGTTPLSLEEEVRIRLGSELKNYLLIFPKDMIKLMTETIDLERYREYTAKHKPYEFASEYYYQKPLQDCTLSELLEMVVLFIKLQNSYESVNYTDEGDHFLFRLTHKYGMNHSRLQLMMIKSLFESYGVKTESRVSEWSLFVKVHKGDR